MPDANISTIDSTEILMRYIRDCLEGIGVTVDCTHAECLSDGQLDRIIIHFPCEKQQSLKERKLQELNLTVSDTARSLAMEFGYDMDDATYVLFIAKLVEYLAGVVVADKEEAYLSESF